MSVVFGKQTNLAVLYIPINLQFLSLFTQHNVKLDASVVLDPGFLRRGMSTPIGVPAYYSAKTYPETA